MLDWAFRYYLPLTTRFVIGRIIDDKIPIRMVCRIIGPVPSRDAVRSGASARPCRARRADR
jgi:hypothetical protein